MEKSADGLSTLLSLWRYCVASSCLCWPLRWGEALRPEVLKVKKVHGTVQIAAQLHSEIPHLFCDSFCECLSTGWISCICYDHEYIPRAYPESRHRKKSPRNIIKGLVHPKRILSLMSVFTYTSEHRLII